MFDFIKKFTSDGEPEKGTLTYAVLPAAGSSTRMGGRNKPLLSLGGQAVLARTLRVFEDCAAIDGIVIVCRKQDMQPYQALCADAGITKVKAMVEGGATRVHSVLQGILACGPEVGYVAIHDGVRPFVTDEIITEAVEAAKRDSAAAPAVPVKDSISRVKNGRMVENVERDSIVAVQTPQCFDIDLIRAALTQGLENDLPLTDDCGAVEALGQPVTITTGSYENIKITTLEDLLIGEAILKGRQA